MPRVYIRKRETKYTLTDLQKAVKDVQENKKTYRQAEEAYNVPISVIYHRIKGRKVDINRMGAGVSKVLPARVEEHIAACLKTRAQMGLSVIKEELKNLVKEYVESNNIVNNFKDNKPGNDWYISLYWYIGNDNTRFLATTEDIDTIPATMIVKNVNLLTLNEKETEFILMDDEDYVYFDY